MPPKRSGRGPTPPARSRAREHAAARAAADAARQRRNRLVAVVIWYATDLGADQLDVLRQVFVKHGKDVLIVPRENMPTPVAATAWLADGRRRLLCQSANATALGNFVDQYANKGPEAIPH